MGILLSLSRVGQLARGGQLFTERKSNHVSVYGIQVLKNEWNGVRHKDCYSDILEI